MTDHSVNFGRHVGFYVSAVRPMRIKDQSLTTVVNGLLLLFFFLLSLKINFAQKVNIKWNYMRASTLL